MNHRLLAALLTLLLGALPATLTAPAAAQEAEEPGAISGRVTDARGLPLQGVCVEVDKLFPAEGGPSARTDILGRYTVSDVAPGPHFVSFNVCREPLAGHAGEWWPDAPGFAGIEPVFVEPGGTASAVDASLEPAGTISGVLSDETSGEPLAGDCVTAINPETLALGQAKTAEDGTYALAALRPAEYVVVFEDCSDPFTSITEYYDDVTAEEYAAGTQPQGVSVVAGEEQTADAALIHGGAVTGTITAVHTGEAVPLACAMLVRAGDDSSIPVQGAIAGFSNQGQPTNDDRYVATAVPAGEYQVQFTGLGCDPAGYKESWYGGATRAGADIIEIQPQVVLEGIDAVLHPVPSIELAPCYPGSPGTEFRDVGFDNVHAEAIECLASAGVVSGRSSTRYAPSRNVRRDQMASFLARLLAASGTALPQDAPDRFSDDNGNVHEEAINQMAQLGIVAGLAGDRYGPDQPVSRGQMASLLAAAYEAATDNALRSVRDWFGDDEGIPHEGRINHTATAGIATGTAKRSFSPFASVRRDQIASFLARTLDRITRDTPLEFFGGGTQEESAPADGGALWKAELVDQVEQRWGLERAR